MLLETGSDASVVVGAGLFANSLVVRNSDFSITAPLFSLLSATDGLVCTGASMITLTTVPDASISALVNATGSCDIVLVDSAVESSLVTLTGSSVSLDLDSTWTAPTMQAASSMITVAGDLTLTSTAQTDILDVRNSQVLVTGATASFSAGAGTLAPGPTSPSVVFADSSIAVQGGAAMQSAQAQMDRVTCSVTGSSSVALAAVTGTGTHMSVTGVGSTVSVAGSLEVTSAPRFDVGLGSSVSVGEHVSLHGKTGADVVVAVNGAVTMTMGGNMTLGLAQIYGSGSLTAATVVLDQTCEISPGTQGTREAATLSLHSDLIWGAAPVTLRVDVQHGTGGVLLSDKLVIDGDETRSGKLQRCWWRSCCPSASSPHGTVSRMRPSPSLLLHPVDPTRG